MLSNICNDICHNLIPILDPEGEDFITYMYRGEALEIARPAVALQCGW